MQPVGPRDTPGAQRVRPGRWSALPRCVRTATAGLVVVVVLLLVALRGTGIAAAQEGPGQGDPPPALALPTPPPPPPDRRAERAAAGPAGGSPQERYYGDDVRAAAQVLAGLDAARTTEAGRLARLVPRPASDGAPAAARPQGDAASQPAGGPGRLPRRQVPQAAVPVPNLGHLRRPEAYRADPARYDDC